MSAKSRRLFDSHLAAQGKPPISQVRVIDVSGVRRRDVPTLPPPADLPAELRKRARHIRALAGALLAEANDLDRAAERNQ